MIPELRFFIINTERKKEVTGEMRHGEASCFCPGADENYFGGNRRYMRKEDER